MLDPIPEARIRAPEIVGIKAWINSRPLTMAALAGKVVLVDFWTYSCVNCRRGIPYLNRWHERYSAKGLVIIGVHTPEFKFEMDKGNVERAVKELGIRYPVALDSDMATWASFDNNQWPAKFLIDKNGYVAYLHFGEGSYMETEMEIQAALGISAPIEAEGFRGYLSVQSPETYAGYVSNDGLGSGLSCGKDGCDRYVDPGEHEENVIYPDGRWEQENEYLELKEAPGRLAYRFIAREANVVMSPVDGPAAVEVSVDGRKISTVTVDRPDMYAVFRDDRYAERELVLMFRGKARVYAYTFG